MLIIWKVCKSRGWLQHVYSISDRTIITNQHHLWWFVVWKPTRDVFSCSGTEALGQLTLVSINRTIWKTALSLLSTLIMRLVSSTIVVLPVLRIRRLRRCYRWTNNLSVGWSRSWDCRRNQCRLCRRNSGGGCNFKFGGSIRWKCWERASQVNRWFSCYRGLFN